MKNEKEEARKLCEIETEIGDVFSGNKDEFVYKMVL